MKVVDREGLGGVRWIRWPPFFPASAPSFRAGWTTCCTNTSSKSHRPVAAHGVLRARCRCWRDAGDPQHTLRETLRSAVTWMFVLVVLLGLYAAVVDGKAVKTKRIRSEAPDRPLALGSR
jgi:hypothetical protein